MIRHLMEWIRKKRESEAETRVVARADRLLANGPVLLEMHRRRLEVLTGQRVELLDEPMQGSETDGANYVVNR